MATTPTSGHTEAPTGRHGGFPPFQKDTFASQIVWLVVIFVALYLLMSRIALPRVGSILDARKAHIDGALAEAERLREQSDAALAAYERSLAEARGRAQALASEAHQKQATAAEANRKSLEATLNARIADAEKTIAATRTAAMTNVQAIASDAVAAIVERLTGVTPAAADVTAAVSATLKG